MVSFRPNDRSTLGPVVREVITLMSERPEVAGCERMASAPSAVINVVDEIHQRKSAAVRLPLNDRFV